MIGFSVVVALTAATTACTGVLVVWVRFGCLPPLRDLVTIELFKADPLFTTARDGSYVREQRFGSGACQIIAFGGATGDGATYVSRRYRTPAVLNLDQLRQRFDQPAAAAGWRVLDAHTRPARPPQPPRTIAGYPMPPPPKPSRDIFVPGNPATITYCRQFGDRRIKATVASTNTFRAGLHVEIRDASQRKTRARSACE